MPKYHLVVDHRNKNFKEIDLSSLKEFDKKSAYKLECIVDYTMRFSTIERLKIELYNKGLIEKGDLDKKLAIIYPYNKEMNKLRNGIALSGDRKFFDQLYLVNFILSKGNDLEFLESFCNNYRNSHYKTNIDEISHYIRLLKLKNIYEGNKTMFRDSVRDFIYKETGIINGVTGEYKINYKKLRDMAMYVSHLEKKLQAKKEKIKEESIQFTFDDLEKNETIKNDIEIDKKSDIEIMYDEGFPPNSEELKNYFEYMENLPDQDYNLEEHKRRK